MKVRTHYFQETAKTRKKKAKDRFLFVFDANEFQTAS